MFHLIRDRRVFADLRFSKNYNLHKFFFAQFHDGLYSVFSAIVQLYDNFDKFMCKFKRHLNYWKSSKFKVIGIFKSLDSKFQPFNNSKYVYKYVNNIWLFLEIFFTFKSDDFSTECAVQQQQQKQQQQQQ